MDHTRVVTLLALGLALGHPARGVAQNAMHVGTVELTAPISLTPPPAMPLASFLGRSRTDVEALLGARSGAGPWVAHGASWALHYEQGCAVELAVWLPPGVDYRAALRALGFRRAGSPHRGALLLRWPEGSARHALGPGLSGTLTLGSGLFRTRLNPELCR